LRLARNRHFSLPLAETTKDTKEIRDSVYMLLNLRKKLSVRRYAATLFPNSLRAQEKVRSGRRSGGSFCSATQTQVTGNRQQGTGHVTPKPDQRELRLRCYNQHK